MNHKSKSTWKWLLSRMNLITLILPAASGDHIDVLQNRCTTDRHVLLTGLSLQSESALTNDAQDDFNV